MAKKKTPYSVHPSSKMAMNVIANMKEKTGRSLDEWAELVKKKAPADEKGRMAWLKEKHGLGTNYAGWITEVSFGRGMDMIDPDLYLAAAEKYVDEMYAGKKEHLRPVYHALLKLGLSVASDVKASPCQTMVPLYRNHVIAQIKPTTNSRIDMGFALKNTKPTGRLIDTGGFAKKDRITHRIEITLVSDIRDDIIKWFKKAYEMDAK
jgi:Domain of unknown function (DUF5655)/Domain of unknown function (DUF4287)